MLLFLHGINFSNIAAFNIIYFSGFFSVFASLFFYIYIYNCTQQINSQNYESDAKNLKSTQIKNRISQIKGMKLSEERKRRYYKYFSNSIYFLPTVETKSLTRAHCLTQNCVNT